MLKDVGAKSLFLDKMIMIGMTKRLVIYVLKFMMWPFGSSQRNDVWIIRGDWKMLGKH